MASKNNKKKNRMAGEQIANTAIGQQGKKQDKNMWQKGLDEFKYHGDQFSSGFNSGFYAERDRAMLKQPGSGLQTETEQLMRTTKNFDKKFNKSFNKFKKKNSGLWDAISTAGNDARAGKSISYIAGDIVGNHLKGALFGNALPAVADKAVKYGIDKYAPQLAKHAATKTAVSGGLATLGKFAGTVGLVHTGVTMADEYLKSKQGQKFLRQTGGGLGTTQVQDDNFYLQRAYDEEALRLKNEHGIQYEDGAALRRAYKKDPKIHDHFNDINKRRRGEMKAKADLLKQEDQAEVQEAWNQKFGRVSPFQQASQYDDSQGGKLKTSWKDDLNKYGDEYSISNEGKEWITNQVTKKTRKEYGNKKVVEYGNLYHDDRDGDRSNDAVHTYNAKSFQHEKDYGESLRGRTVWNTTWSEVPHTNHKLTVRQAQSSGKDKLHNHEWQQSHPEYVKSYGTTHNYGDYKGKYVYGKKNVPTSEDQKFYIGVGENEVLAGDYNAKQDQFMRSSMTEAIAKGGLDHGHFLKEQNIFDWN